jgi:DNA-binding NtrC family response regulator
MTNDLPRLLIVDDLFGRHLSDGTNQDRDNLCASFMLRDVTGDVVSGKKNLSKQRIKSPIAEAVFIRGQMPDCASLGDEVRNDMDGTLEIVRQGWIGSGKRFKRWSMVLLDLCFYTGVVTGKTGSSVSGASRSIAEPGMPEGRAEDTLPAKFFGIQLLKAIQSLYPEIPVVILSSQDRDQVSHEYSAHGALGFLPRTAPDGEDRLRAFLDRQGLLSDPYGLIIGRSLPLLKALRAVRRTAYNDSRDNILIRGERGVGKEELARFVHRVHPSRANKELVSINSAVLTSGLYASELFGIEKRKATGVDKHEGAVARAHQGDVFFDEVKDMIPEAQAALLRFLEEGTFTPTGAREEIAVDVRVISATNADLDHYAVTSRFRDDLLDRLRRGGSILLPPLRDRKEDIPLLAESFLRKTETALTSATKGTKFMLLTRQFSDESLELLMEYDWPGNIRVLRDIVTKVVKDNDVEFIYPVQIEKAFRDLGINSTNQSLASIDRLPFDTSIPSSEKILNSGSEVTTASEIATEAKNAKASRSIDSVHSMLFAIEDFEFDLSNPDALYNQLDALDEAACKLVVRYLLASLRATKDHATGAPEVTKAMKFASGKQKLPTSAAYDLVKRLFKRNTKVFDWAMTEPLLRQAFEQAESTRLSNRPRNG